MCSPTALEQLGPSLVHPIDSSAIEEVSSDSSAHTIRTLVREVAGMQKEALVERAGAEASWRLSSDEGDYLDGADVAPSPLANMAAGMAAGYLDAIFAIAAERDVSIDDCELTLDTFYTMRGSALRGDMSGGVLAPELAVRIESEADQVTIQPIIDDAVERAVVTDLLRRDLTNRYTLTLDGMEVEPDRVPEAETVTPPDPNATFAQVARPTSPHRPTVIRLTGRETEDFPGDHEKYTAGEGSSLAEEQDRVLHLRAEATPRDDGLYLITQKIYSPKGSVFETLVEPVKASNDRAPPAMAYVSAGIGFCFMTQFGRYAEITRKDLSSYRIVQDLSWKRGSPNGSPGQVEPIETHVYLETSEGESFARELLDFSEQTCFLHALCRSSVSPAVTITRG